jgi:hypothetical protein
MKSIRRTATLIEQPGKGWLWAQYDRTFKTLVGAAKAVQKDSRELVSGDGHTMAITVWEYHPQTVAGSLIVKAVSRMVKDGTI